MASTLFELKKQASFFFREKIKTARLVLTDVTPIEMLAEEATCDNPWGPDTRTLGSISKAAFEVDDYLRVVAVLHKRLSTFDSKNWRSSYNSLILLEYLLTHGPESVAGEFRSDEDVIMSMTTFQFIDERGYNWGLTVSKKADRVLELLEKGEFYKEERARSRKVTRGIQGFGSGSMKQPRGSDSPFRQGLGNGISTKGESGGKRLMYSKSFSFFGQSAKENMAPMVRDSHKWTLSGEDDSLVNGAVDEISATEEVHTSQGMYKQDDTRLLSENANFQDL